MSDDETVEPLKAWAACPRCGVERWHLFGERGTVRTGTMVKSLEIVGPIKVGFVDPLGPPDFDPIPTRLVARELLSDRVDRECLDCGHVWAVEVAKVVARGRVDGVWVGDGSGPAGGADLGV